MAQKVTIGRIVRYVDPEGGQWPAIVTEVVGEGIVNLQVFRNSDIVSRLSVPYGESGTTARWYWPERS